MYSAVNIIESNQPKRLLLAEDDAELNVAVSTILKKSGYYIDTFTDGMKAWNAIQQNHYDALLLDLMLPSLDGLRILKSLRKKSNTPVVIVSAKGAEEERILGLRQGADDYLSKPFNLTELTLKVDALMRRISPICVNSAFNLSLMNLNLNRQTKTASVKKQAIELTDIQFDLLWEFANHIGEVLSKAYLSEVVLCRPLGAYDRSIDMHVSRVRKKLNDLAFTDKKITTVHGKGFVFK